MGSTPGWPPRNGGGRATASAARERILGTAAALFYRHGINSVGIDLVIAKSGVAKMTLYRHFRSKEELVLASLDRLNDDWSAWLQARVAAAPVRDVNRPLAVFDALEEWFATPDFRGCPFVGTAAESKDPSHPVHRAAWRCKRMLRDYLRDLLRQAGHRDAIRLADQLLLLVDGTIVRAAMQGGTGSVRAARRAAAILLRP